MTSGTPESIQNWVLSGFQNCLDLASISCLEAKEISSSATTTSRLSAGPRRSSGPRRSLEHGGRRRASRSRSPPRTRTILDRLANQRTIGPAVYCQAVVFHPGELNQNY